MHLRVCFSRLCVLSALRLYFYALHLSFSRFGVCMYFMRFPPAVCVRRFWYSIYVFISRYFVLCVCMLVVFSLSRCCYCLCLVLCVFKCLFSHCCVCLLCSLVPHLLLIKLFTWLLVFHVVSVYRLWYYIYVRIDALFRHLCVYLCCVIVLLFFIYVLSCLVYLSFVFCYRLCYFVNLCIFSLLCVIVCFIVLCSRCVSAFVVLVVFVAFAL